MFLKMQNCNKDLKLILSCEFIGYHNLEYLTKFNCEMLGINFEDVIQHNIIKLNGVDDNILLWIYNACDASLNTGQNDSLMNLEHAYLGNTQILLKNQTNIELFSNIDNVFMVDNNNPQHNILGIAYKLCRIYKKLYINKDIILYNGFLLTERFNWLPYLEKFYDNLCKNLCMDNNDQVKNLIYTSLDNQNNNLENLKIFLFTLNTKANRINNEKKKLEACDIANFCNRPIFDLLIFVKAEVLEEVKSIIYKQHFRFNIYFQVINEKLPLYQFKIFEYNIISKYKNLLYLSLNNYIFYNLNELFLSDITNTTLYLTTEYCSDIFLFKNNNYFRGKFEELLKSYSMSGKIINSSLISNTIINTAKLSDIFINITNKNIDYPKGYLRDKIILYDDIEKLKNICFSHNLPFKNVYD